jgi:hypothetical protein
LGDFLLSGGHPQTLGRKNPAPLFELFLGIIGAKSLLISLSLKGEIWYRPDTMASRKSTSASIR